MHSCKCMVVNGYVCMYGYVVQAFILHIYWWARLLSVEKIFVKNSNARSTEIFVTTTTAYVKGPQSWRLTSI